MAQKTRAGLAGLLDRMFGRGAAPVEPADATAGSGAAEAGQGGGACAADPHDIHLDTLQYLDLTEAPEVLAALYEKTATYWRNVASDPEEMYFSVITDPQFAGLLDHDMRAFFLSTGAHDIDRVQSILDRWLMTEGKPVMLDFGVGVGRLACNAAPLAERLHAVDFSRAHLDEAKVNAEMLGLTNMEFIAVDGLDDMEALPKVDAVYSLLVLQHNTPPVMARLLRGLLAALNPGGVAVIHIPLASINYQFDAATYLDSPEFGAQMEMHVLPRNNLNEIADQAGCDVVASYSHGGTVGLYSEWVTFRKLAG